MKLNALNNQELFFGHEIDFENFSQILSTLNHVQPKYISREDYTKLSGDILSVVGKDKVGDLYELSLPQDLKKAELLEIIFLLNTHFHLETYAQFDVLISRVKLLVELILRDMKASEKDAFLSELILESQVSEKVLAIIQNQKLLFLPTKEILTSFAGEKLSKDELLLELQDILGKEFYLTFFRKGVNMLRLGMMTITQAEVSQVKGKKGEIHVYSHIRDFDKEERFLRDKIGIDDLKYEIEQSKLQGNLKIVERIKLKAVRKILTVLHEYPFQITQEDFGYQPSKILETKELYCIGVSILGHAFLSELEVPHFGLSLPEHSALEVILDNQRYYFDGTTGVHLFKIKSLRQLGDYEYVDLEQAGKKYIQRGNPEMVLLGHICSNIGVSYLDKKMYSEAFHIFKKGILINPHEAFLYKMIADSLCCLNMHNDAFKYLEIAIKIKPNDPDILNAYGVALSGISQHQESLEYFEKALKYDKDLVDGFRNKALSYYFLERYDDALIVTELGLKKYPKDTLLLFGKAGILVKLKKYLQALPILDSLYTILNNDCDYYFNRGEIFEFLGKIKLANYYYFLSDLLSGKETFLDDEVHYKIKDFVIHKDFLGLQNFMISLEKNSN